MYQSYLLLRNNEQTGPYTLEQLLQLDLKPFDLVWEEGRSAAWRYPGEIDSLKAYLTETPQTLAGPLTENNFASQPLPPPSEAKKVFVSLPAKKPFHQAVAPSMAEPNIDTDALILQKAEDLRRRVQSYAEQKPREEYQPVEKMENNFSYFQKSTRKNKISYPLYLILTGLLIIAIATWYFVPSGKPSVPHAKPMVNNASPSELSTSLLSGPEKETALSTGSIQDIPAKITRNTSRERLNIKLTPGKKEIPPASEQSTGIKDELPDIAQSEDPLPAAVPSISEVEPVENKKDKKKIRDVVRNIFKPRDKEKAVVAEDEAPKPATGRKSNKRAEAGMETPGTEQVREQIDISSNDQGNWMMGVSGLKVTVRNRNNLPLQSVIVIVSYFDSNKKLLEKKELNFRNITSNGKMTLTAPEHRWADHTEISMGDVQIGRDAYALDR